jgi:DNA uptake protein ComE-like DNA-binding protein
MKLPGVGDATAMKIMITENQNHSKARRQYDVKGIGEKKFEKKKKNYYN